MRHRSVLVVPLAFSLGAATAVAVRAFVDRRGEPAHAVDTLTVVVAVADIPRGGTVEIDQIRMAEVPKAMVPEGALTDRAEALGRIVATPLAKGETLLAAKLLPKGAKRGMEFMVTPGMRASTITTTGAAAGLDGFVMPGNTVDVLLTMNDWDHGDGTRGEMTSTLLQRATILAVDQSLGTPAEDESADRDLCSVTLLVTPPAGQAPRPGPVQGDAPPGLAQPRGRRRGGVAGPR